VRDASDPAAIHRLRDAYLNCDLQVISTTRATLRTTVEASRVNDAGAIHVSTDP